MEQRFYLDTSIWIDLYEDRKGYLDEPLDDFAFELILFIRKNNHKIVLTNFLMSELQRRITLEEINGMLKPFEKLIETMIVSEEQLQEAKIICKKKQVPFGDAVHAIIARDYDLILVSRDKHFKLLEEISKCNKPEELI